MRSRLKKAGCYIIIIVLLPYIVTVFLSGPLVETGAPAADTLTVKAVKGEEETTLPLSDYCIGRMARLPLFLVQAYRAKWGGKE